MPEPTRGRGLGRWLARGGPTALGLQLAELVAGHVPTPVRYGLADLGGWAAYHLLSDRAAVTRANFRPVLGPGRPPQAVDRVARRAFQNYGRTVVDFLTLDRLVADLQRRGPVAGAEHLETALAEGHGAILVSAHFGNWDLGAASAALTGHPVHTLADPFGPPAVDERVRRARERLGVHVLDPGTAGVRAALRVLRRNEILALAADLDPGTGGVLVPFFGRLAVIPAGPAALALRTGAPIVAGYIWRDRDGRYQGAVEPPVRPDPTADRAVETERLTAAMIASFERAIRRAPAQWSIFRPIWRAPVEDAR
ncbi:MAG TPA: hypothetical protein VMW49_06650 [Candidatus Dormibacteraeota bacterium]|nr:hypothetical protein [Candidatus Dormibacteraeota bacterium]